MQLTLTFDETATNVDIAKRLREHANRLVSSSATVTTTAKPSKKARTEVPADDTFGDEVEETETTETEDEETMDDLGSDFEEEMEAKKSAKGKDLTKASLDGVRKALKAYATKYGREKAALILKKKFSVKSVDDLKPGQYGLVIKAATV